MSIRALVFAVTILVSFVGAGAQRPLVNLWYGENQVTMRDAQTGQILIDPRGMPLYIANDPASLPASIAFVPHPCGFDVVYKIANTYPEPRPIGEFAIAVITLGPLVKWWDFRTYSTPLMAQTGPAQWCRGYWYPADLYSPVSVLANDKHAVGVSIQYPILTYGHDMVVTSASLPAQYAAGEGGMGWVVSFTPSAYARGPSEIRPCMVPPGHQRTYTVSVRVTTHPDQWVRTLVPYRQYFRGMYGMVQYERWPAPWVGIGLADGSWISGTNPSGWSYTTRRPDVHGWGPWVDHIQIDQGEYDRAILWTPTGLYNQHIENNYPFQFTSQWLAHPNVAEALDPNLGLPRVPAGGQMLGLWWGRSLQVAPQWNPVVLQPFHLENPDHVIAAFRELDLAVEAGATVIGLDAFNPTATPVWEQIEWLARMRQRAPGVRFVTEPMSCDILHRLTPTLVDAWRDPDHPQSPEELYAIHHPNYLADFLLPEHEIWGALRWDGWVQHFGHPPTAARMRADAMAVAACGYVPVLFGTVPVPNRNFSARRTWETTVPVDLRP